MGASDPILASLATVETWSALRTACDAFGDECDCSPSLLVMRQSLQETLCQLGEA